MLEDNHRWT